MLGKVFISLYVYTTRNAFNEKHVIQHMREKLFRRTGIIATHKHTHTRSFCNDEEKPKP